MTRKKDKIEVASPQELDTYSYGDDDGLGFDNQDADDYTIPMVKLCQAMTPEVADKGHDASAGDWLNTITSDIYDDGIVLIPAATEHLYVKWVIRDDGGGFRGHLQTRDPIVLDAIASSTTFGLYEIQETITTDGRDKQITIKLEETFYIYGVLSDSDGNIISHGVCIPFKSSMIPVYKRLMTLYNQFAKKTGTPLYANATRFTSQSKTNAKGTFYVPFASPADPRGMLQSRLRKDDPRFLAAKELRESILSGGAKVDFDSQQTDGEKPIPF